ncbi:Centromere/kinetochore protein zw10 [Phytophthora boehmeriae]|uniref:Centromere/kinetochore protein zw10 n=1 Tax=Phytophthora boehmeriae TaxID=109152 RepID=A0A8T1XCN9_9STRA|nr:Centromere/kinetochore protein zw10 [Phytophthora boehmeriae]
MESSLDTLTRKLEETHAEIDQVRGDVVGALRSFYASSSSISADEAVKIAAKWGTSHAFSMDEGDVDSSDLQEKMRRLNVALLDAVGRLQLDESEDLAPEAQLLLSFIQREKLKQQVQQSKNMLALIEQLTEMDRLLGDVDDAMDSQRFVSAAEGIAEVERLVLELVEVKKENDSGAEDISIIRVMKMQLLNRKNRLLNQLTRYFACTVVWQEGALKVLEKPCTDDSFESDKQSSEAQKHDFWTACKVLNILTPKLKEVAKGISQYLIKPMLQQPYATVERIYEDGVITLKLAVRDENNGDSGMSEAGQVQEKCSNVVSVLEFVFTVLFAGNTEIMAQLGDLIWKIPGNLEAQLTNLIQDMIPQNAATLDEYRDLLATAVTTLENSLVSIGFSACNNNQLSGLVDQLNQLHSKKRRQTILSNGRDLMRQGYHDSVKIKGGNEKCNLNPSMGFGKKGKVGGKGGVGSDTAPANSNADDVESSCFRIPDYRVTVCVHELVEMVHQTLLESCTADVASAKLLFQTGRDLFLLFRTIVPTIYEDDIANNPRSCMLYHNDCLYITYHMLIIGHLYKHRLPSPLNQTATMVDMVPALRDNGERALTSYAAGQTDEIVSGIKALPALGALDSERDMERVETFIRGTLYKLNEMSSSWHEGLPLAVYNKIMSRMVEPLVKSFVENVLAVPKISENAGAHLHHLLSLLLECEGLFDSPTQAVKHVPSIGRLSKLTAILMDPLTSVHDKFNAGSLDAFTPKELAVLVKSLFRESPEKKAFLQELLAAA